MYLNKRWGVIDFPFHFQFSSEKWEYVTNHNPTDWLEPKTGLNSVDCCCIACVISVVLSWKSPNWSTHQHIPEEVLSSELDQQFASSASYLARVIFISTNNTKTIHTRLDPNHKKKLYAHACWNLCPNFKQYTIKNNAGTRSVPE